MNSRVAGVCLVALWMLVFSLAVMTGSGIVDWADLLVSGTVSHQIVSEVRLPRALLASLLGGGLALAGASIQGVFRNPLADPALIGISGGAALFAASYLVIVPYSDFMLIGLSASAMLGGVLATGLVLLIGGRQTDVATLLLAGIAINAICLAGVGLLSFLAPEQRFRSVSFWALGSFNHVGWIDVFLGFVVLPGILRLMMLASVLDVLTLGDVEARHLGIRAKARRIEVILWAALITGVSVSLVGIIAFVGLIVPHWVRMTIGARHVLVLPFSMIAGALLLIAADWLSRWLIAPIELPVGIVTTLLGAPLFVVLVARWSRGVWL